MKLACFLITMLQGPVDLGINLVTNDQVTAIMMMMAGSDDHLMQSVAAELIVQTVSKHERATNILKVGYPILRKLYNSTDENVKVRALVVGSPLLKKDILLFRVCVSVDQPEETTSPVRRWRKAPSSTWPRPVKSSSSTTISTPSMSEGTPFPPTPFLFPCFSKACEGLSYLSLDADVKEWIVEDPLLLQALFTLAKSAGAICVYTLASIYVNLTNSYEKPDVSEELVKLAQVGEGPPHLNGHFSSPSIMSPRLIPRIRRTTWRRGPAPW